MISPKSNGQCGFIKLRLNEQKDLVNLCFKDLEINKELVSDNTNSLDLIKNCIKILYTSISNILKNSSGNSELSKHLNEIKEKLVKLAEYYKINLEKADSKSDIIAQDSYQNLGQDTVPVPTNIEQAPIKTVKMILNDTETEIQVLEENKENNEVQVKVNGKAVWRKIGEDGYITLEENDLTKAKELKEMEDLKAKIRKELIENEKKRAKYNIENTTQKMTKLKEIS